MADAGKAPMNSSITLPSLKSLTVGRLRTPWSIANCCSLSVSTLARWKRPSYSSARVASIGINILHGAHQSAQKSTATGLSCDWAMTSTSKVVALTSVTWGVSSMAGDRVR